MLQGGCSHAKSNSYFEESVHTVPGAGEGWVSVVVPGHDQAGHCRGAAAAGAPLRQLGAVPGGAVLRPAHRHHGRVARAQVTGAGARQPGVSVGVVLQCPGGEILLLRQRGRSLRAR